MTFSPAGEPPQRRGWRIPRDAAVHDDALRVPPRDRASAGQPSAVPDSRTPRRTLRGSVSGQVADVLEASFQEERDTPTEPIVSLRLERNNPHSGWSFVASVQLQGSDAVGFARVGDWIEAVGKDRSAHLLATRCVNHTTGAVYRRSGTTLTTVGHWIHYVLAAVLFLLFGYFAFGMLSGRGPGVRAGVSESEARDAATQAIAVPTDPAGAGRVP